MMHSENFTHDGIPITVDDRELRSPVAAILRADADFLVQIRRLTVGDYLLDERFLVERKQLPDLLDSIKSGRLFSQVLRLARAEAFQPVLLLEGTSRDLAGSAMSWEAIQGALVMVSLHIGIPILRSRSAEESAKTFRFMARQGRMVAKGALPRRGKRPGEKRALQCRLLQGLPGIGPERASGLLDHFGSIEAVLTAGVEALSTVPGIGKQTANKIRWTVEEAPASYFARSPLP